MNQPMCYNTLCQPVEYRKLQARTETPHWGVEANFYVFHLGFRVSGFTGFRFQGLGFRV